ncbi:DMT family transporter [Frigidibacter sp. MR17.14]|uniref:DMT family transporter n=1 Tax=Frigidibacter sp. MR17.14 TaxID=3126509 RepID=UPI003012C873
MRLILMVGLAMLAFAANSLLNRLALAGGGIGPSSFAAVRLAAGAATLVALAALRPRGFRPGLGPRRAVGVASLALYMLGFSFAYLTLDAGAGALVLFGAVQLTMFAGALALGEQVPARRALGAGLAFAGLCLLAWPSGAARLAGSGVALMAAAGLGWGIYSLAGRGAADPLGDTAANFLLALPLGLMALVLRPDVVAPGAAGVGLAALSGAVTSGLGYALWYACLPRLAASRAAVAQLTVPVIAALGGALLLAETPGPRFWAAAALVIGGVTLSLAGRRPR